MILFIDTTDNDFAKIALITGKKVVSKTWQTKRLSETLMPIISSLLKRQKVKFQDLHKIVVVKGPGFFSRLRTGVATANALAFALNIPVAGTKRGFLKLKFQNQVLPYYSAKPNITKPNH